MANSIASQYHTGLSIPAGIISVMDRTGSAVFEESMTSSNDSSQDDGGDSPSLAWLIVVPLVVGTIIVVTVVGNAFVIVAYWIDRRIHGRVANLLILNLAIADFITGLCVLSVNLAWITWNEWLGGDYWLLGEYFCKVWLVIDYTATMMSVLIIILISLDRFWLMTKKLHYNAFQTRKRVIVTVTVLWVLTALVYVAIAFGWTAMTGEESVDFEEECEFDMGYNVYAVIAQMLLEFIIPLAIIVVLNAIVFSKIKVRSKGMQKLGAISSVKPSKSSGSDYRSSSSGASVLSISKINLVMTKSASARDPVECSNNVDETTFSNSDPGQQKEPEYEDSPRKVSTTERMTTTTTTTTRNFARYRRAAIVLAVLVSVFIVCWLPYQIVNVINAVYGDDCISNLTWEIVNNILWCNSFINPFLYSATNVHFRRNFVNFLGLRRCRVFQKTIQVTGRPSSEA